MTKTGGLAQHDMYTGNYRVATGGLVQHDMSTGNNRAATWIVEGTDKHGAITGPAYLGVQNLLWCGEQKYCSGTRNDQGEEDRNMYVLPGDIIMTEVRGTWIGIYHSGTCRPSLHQSPKLAVMWRTEIPFWNTKWQRRGQKYVCTAWGYNNDRGERDMNRYIPLWNL